MNLIMFATRVDNNLNNFAWARSQMSQIQKDVCDQMIKDHYGKSSIDETAKLIRTCLNSLRHV